MKFLFLLPLFIIFSFSAFAQYFYNDIVGNRKINDEYVLMKSSSFKKIVLESFEDDDSPSEGFFCEKKFANDFSSSEMVSKSYITGESELKTIYKDGKVFKTIATTPHTNNTTLYQYDGTRLKSIKTETIGFADSTVFTEERDFNYDSSGLPVSMKRFKNGKQISLIQFKHDSKGNVIEETPLSGNSDQKYYYYYDEKNQLTDVVHFNPIAQKLLPDYMFLYNDQGQVSQMISVDESGRNYTIWRYSYTPSGLSEIQKCYSKEKRLLGTIQYEYSR